MPKSEHDGIVYSGSSTFYLLTLVEHNVASNIHVIANKGVAAGVLDGTFNSRLVLNHVHCKSCPFGERSVLIIDGFHLDAIKWNEGCVARPLVAHILYTSLFNTHIKGDGNHVLQYSRWRSFPHPQQPHPCFYRGRPRLPTHTSSESVCINQQRDPAHLRGSSVTGPEPEQRLIPVNILDRLASVSLSFASFSDSCRSTLACSSRW